MKIKVLFQNPLFYLAVSIFSVIAHNSIYALTKVEESFFFTLFFISSFLLILFSFFWIFASIKLHFSMKPIRGAVVILKNKNNEYLLIKNTKSGNISFPGGKTEDGEEVINSAIREVNEEVGLLPKDFSIRPSGIVYRFIFNNNKPDRTGMTAKYAVFVGDVSEKASPFPTSDAKEIFWLSYGEVLKKLSFNDLVRVFKKAAR